MNYYIALINQEQFEWCILATDSEDFAYKVFEEFSAPPGWNAELRATTEDVDTHLNYEVLRYDYSQFDM